MLQIRRQQKGKKTFLTLLKGSKVTGDNVKGLAGACRKEEREISGNHHCITHIFNKILLLQGDFERKRGNKCASEKREKERALSGRLCLSDTAQCKKGGAITFSLLLL